MKFIRECLLGFALLIGVNGAAYAQAISALPGASALSGTEILPCVQSSITSGCTANQIRTLSQTYPSAALVGTAQAGLQEYDGTTFYDTAAGSSRQVRDSQQLINLTATYTLTSTTAAQKLFNSTTNGTLTVQGSTSYYYDCSFSISSMSATSGNAGFDIKGAGTASITSAAMWSSGLDATTQTTAAATGGVFVASTGQAGDIVPATTGTAMSAHVWGIVRTNVAGTLIPSVSLTTAAAAVVGVNSYCRLWPFGSNVVTNVGNWN